MEKCLYMYFLMGEEELYCKEAFATFVKVAFELFIWDCVLNNIILVFV